MRDNATATPLIRAIMAGTFRIHHDPANPRLSAPRLAEISGYLGILDEHGQAVWDITLDAGGVTRVAVYREVVDSLEVLS
jgi:hypothetical protein